MRPIIRKQGLDSIPKAQEPTVDLYKSDDATEEEFLEGLLQLYEDGDPVACDTLACFFYERDDYWKAFPFVLKSAQRGKEYFYYILAQMYSYDEESWPLTNYSLALHWFMKAYEAEPNDSDICYSIGRQYMMGLGVPANIEEGLRWYKKGKRWGAIAYWYSKGWQDHPQDLKTAESFLLKISPNDLTRAEKKLLKAIREGNVRDISGMFQE